MRDSLRRGALILAVMVAACATMFDTPARATTSANDVVNYIAKNLGQIAKSPSDVKLRNFKIPVKLNIAECYVSKIALRDVMNGALVSEPGGVLLMKKLDRLYEKHVGCDPTVTSTVLLITANDLRTTKIGPDLAAMIQATDLEGLVKQQLDANPQFKADEAAVRAKLGALDRHLLRDIVKAL